MAAVLGLSVEAAAQSPEQVDAFFDLVAIGSAADVAEALKRDPALATARDRFGFTPLHVLDYADFEAKIALLIEAGADINAQNDEGISPLHTVIDPEFVPIIVVAGADTELRDHRGRTPLLAHLTEPDALPMVKALLAAGADPRVRDSSGQSALDYAVFVEDQAVTEVLRTAGAR